jgi:MFS transporter, FHS family, L-fucose permease
VPQQRPAPLLWVMFFAFFTFGLMGVLGALTPDIIKEFSLTRFEAGLLASSMLVAVAGFALPSGMLADRIGARRVIMGGVALMAIGCFAVSQSRNYPVILAMVFTIGTGVTMLQTAANPLIQLLDATEKYHRNLTFTIACATFGGFLSIFFLAYIRGMGRPWQDYYLLFGSVCVLLLLLLAFSKFPAPKSASERFSWKHVGALLRNPILITYGLGVYLYGPAEIGTYYWIPKFFEDIHGVSGSVVNAQATTFLAKVFPSMPALIFALFLGMQGVGRLLGGAVLHHFGSRWVMRVYSAMALVCLTIAITGSTYVSAVGFVACGFFMSVLFPLLFSGTISSFSEHHGTISGLLCTSYVAHAVVIPSQGWVGDHFGMRWALVIPAVCLSYVVGLSIWGRAKYD